MAFAKLPQWHVYDDAGHRKYITNDERRRFLAEADALPLSQRVLCGILVFTGCRISEALSLTCEHVDFEQGTVTLKTLKRRKVAFRTVPIPSELLAMLQRLPHQADGRYWAVHRTTAWRWIKHLMTQVHIAGPMACCRGLRHGFGMRAAMAHLPLNLIQRLMGHASPTTTLVYMEASGAEEAEFIRRMW